MEYTMEFCVCGNMLYSKIEEDKDGFTKLLHFCKNCGKVNDTVSNTTKPVISENYNLDDIKRHMVNDYTFDDPTLPRALRVQCPNKDCPDKNPIIKYKVYDEKNKKFIYGCLSCKKKGKDTYIW